ncbi:uncharacterized protein C8Q71DRAFT_769178 [Rhodofomes roseus]|uniref:OTU domain-containing protein n=1 Tax=Rhodofomes roseus TaxID=34475 RepID=A0ABQ8KAT4_9APHY|nr:uncharacterized protein C8Q71DRAFT_769178 [Rhodofomes roseus]KAH9834493.1 hypothetical protein C8Q71DRAFT_769178 [Rhodofomes roseus]
MSRSTSGKMIAVRLPVVPAARSTIAPAKEPQPDLPPPFKPRSVYVTKDAVLGARDVAPFILLPRIFIPVPSALWKPPLMHYGWPVPRQRLLEYAEKHGLTKFLGRRNPKVFPDETDSESEFSTDDDETEDNEDESSDRSSESGSSSDGSRTVVAAHATRARKPCPPVDPPAKPARIDTMSTMFGALRHIRDSLNGEHGTQFDLPAMQICPTLQDGEGECQIVSVYTNYHFLRKDLPLPEHIAAFGEAVGVEMPPRWFLDEEQYEWWSVNYPRRR